MPNVPLKEYLIYYCCVRCARARRQEAVAGSLNFPTLADRYLIYY